MIKIVSNTESDIFKLSGGTFQEFPSILDAQRHLSKIASTLEADSVTTSRALKIGDLTATIIDDHEPPQAA